RAPRDDPRRSRARRDPYRRRLGVGERAGPAARGGPGGGRVPAQAVRTRAARHDRGAAPERGRLNRGRSSLVSRILAASCLLALLVAASFGVLIVAIGSLRRANDRETRSKDVTVAALQLENTVISLETALRGYALTNNQRLKDSFYEANKNVAP